MYQDLFDPNVIQIVQGNTADITIDLSREKGDITLSESDVVLFTVNSKRGNTVIQKTLTMSDLDPEIQTNLICKIKSSETRNLITGEYLYDCLYAGSDGQRTTFISSILRILPAVGFYDGPGPKPPEPTPTDTCVIYADKNNNVYVDSNMRVYANIVKDGDDNG